MLLFEKVAESVRHTTKMQMAFLILPISAFVLQCYFHSYTAVVNASEIGAYIIYLKDFRSIMVTSVEHSSSSSNKLLCWENDRWLFYYIRKTYDWCDLSFSFLIYSYKSCDFSENWKSLLQSKNSALWLATQLFKSVILSCFILNHIPKFHSPVRRVGVRIKI